MCDDILYPIYSVRAWWTEAREAKHPMPGTPDPGEGRAWDQVSHCVMLREEMALDDVAKLWRAKYWPAYAERATAPGDMSVREVVFRFKESWCLKWFQHWTFDVGQSDKEVIDSFYRYVARMRTDRPDEPLMHASEPSCWSKPCRCEHCREEGIIMIDH